VVCIVAVLVVTVASQARNNTRQQQIDEEPYGDNNVVLSGMELRHPRYIGRPVTAPDTNGTTESIIVKNVKALVMRVVGPETLGNSGDGTSEASRQILHPEIGTADKEPDSRVASSVISRNN